MVDPYNATPVYRQLAEAIRHEIVTGRLTPGSRLPSEADLAYEHKVGRATVRSALRELRAEGLIESRRGSVPVVREIAEVNTRRIPRGARVRFRMPTPEERAEHHIPEGVPVAEVSRSDGTVEIYIGDRDELAT